MSVFLGLRYFACDGARVVERVGGELCRVFVATASSEFRQAAGENAQAVFFDTGLMAYLLGIRDAETLSTHTSRGVLFETLVVSEWVKRQFNAGQVAELYFWRDSAGHEVDLLIPQGNRFMPVEIKSGATFSNDWTAALRKLSALFGDAALPLGIVYGGDGQYERDGCRVIGWQFLAHALE